jgi:hypothetical protein
MQASLTALIHDGAVLHRFADFIEEYCKEQERSQRYIDASGEFFRYAERLARGIKLELRDEVERATRFKPEIAESRIASLRRKMVTLKDYLRLMHTLIKPAADAHTLSIPAPLINLAFDQLRQIEGMKDSRIVVLLTPQLMYFQRPHTHVKQQAGRVDNLIPKTEFPAKLGFIELPYSQGPSFFTNLAIYHEIGHFVYEELSTLTLPNPHVAALESATDQSLTKFPELRGDPQVRALAEKIIESWTQEIFCDLFALRLVGPAFSFALVEILGMLGSLSPEAMVTFDQEHPAPAFRFAEHVRFLREDSWWSAIAHIEPEQKKLLQKLARIPRSKYKVYADDEGPKGLMGAFLDSIVPAIRELARHVTPEANSAAKRFRETRKTIEECLGVGVVPHANTSSPPDPVSIINSAFCFYLTSLPQVVMKFEGAVAKNNVRIRSKWTKKLEDWTMKAIEDSQVRSQFERTQGNGPS